MSSGGSSMNSGGSSTSSGGGSMMGKGGSNSNAGGASNGGSGTGGSSTGGGAGMGTGGSSTGGGAGMGTGGAPDMDANVLERNKHANRDGAFVQPTLDAAAAAKMATDAMFKATFSGNMWASPLYLEKG